jgi:hypothetical protein
VQQLRTDAFAVVTYPHPKLPPAVAKLELDPLRCRMAEGVPKRLAGDPEHLVPHSRPQRTRGTPNFDAQDGKAAFDVLALELPAKSAYRVDERVLLGRGDSQPLHRGAAVGVAAEDTLRLPRHLRQQQSPSLEHHGDASPIDNGHRECG